MTKKKDLTGMIFGGWTVIKDAGYNSKAGKSMFSCVCECGTERDVVGGGLTSGMSTSCGCRKKELTRKRFTKHGRYGHPLYERYLLMIKRCNDPDNGEYKNYGARGIKVCDRWMESFEDYADDMGLPPTNTHSIDRSDNDGDYTPENCRWATKREQSENKRTTRIVEFNGRSMSLAAWAREVGMTKCGMYARIRKGWSVEEAITTPPIPRGRYNRSDPKKAM